MVELRGGVSGPLGWRHLGGSVSVSPRLSVLVPLHGVKFRRYWATAGHNFGCSLSHHLAPLGFRHLGMSSSGPERTLAKLSLMYSEAGWSYPLEVEFEAAGARLSCVRFE